MTNLESRIAEVIQYTGEDLTRIAEAVFPKAVALAQEVINTCCNCQSWTPDDPCGDPKCRLARELMAGIEEGLK